MTCEAGRVLRTSTASQKNLKSTADSKQGGLTAARMMAGRRSATPRLAVELLNAHCRHDGATRLWRTAGLPWLNAHCRHDGAAPWSRWVLPVYSTVYCNGAGTCRRGGVARPRRGAATADTGIASALTGQRGAPGLSRSARVQRARQRFCEPLRGAPPRGSTIPHALERASMLPHLPCEGPPLIASSRKDGRRLTSLMAGDGLSVDVAVRT